MVEGNILGYLETWNQCIQDKVALKKAVKQVLKLQPNVKNSEYREFLQRVADHCEDQNHYQLAFKAIQESNIYWYRYSDPKQIKKHTQRLDHIKNVCDDDFCNHLSQSTSHSNCPILALGLPRSGKTTLGKILGLHDAIEHGDELDVLDNITSDYMSPFPDIVQEKTPDSLNEFSTAYLSSLQQAYPNADRVVDTKPTNIQYVGFLLSLFPNMKVLYCVRNQEDVSWEMYRRHFGKEYYDFTCSKKDIVLYIKSYESLMQHWLDSMPEDRIMTIAFEDMIKAPEKTLKSTLSFLSEENYDNETLFRKVASLCSSIQEKVEINDHYRSFWVSTE